MQQILNINLMGSQSVLTFMDFSSRESGIRTILSFIHDFIANFVKKLCWLIKINTFNITITHAYGYILVSNVFWTLMLRTNLINKAKNSLTLMVFLKPKKGVIASEYCR